MAKNGILGNSDVSLPTRGVHRKKASDHTIVKQDAGLVAASLLIFYQRLLAIAISIINKYLQWN